MSMDRGGRLHGGRGARGGSEPVAVLDLGCRECGAPKTALLADGEAVCTACGSVLRAAPRGGGRA